MSRGIKTIGTFNSESFSHIDQIKQKAAELIDLIDVHAKDPRRASIAITGIEQAVMMGVKATFEQV